MFKRLTAFIGILLMVFQFSPVSADPGDANPPISIPITPTPGGRPRQEVGEINAYYQNGQIWFSFAEDDCGGLSVTLTHVATGQTVIDYVTDSTPIAITLPSGTISIVCIDDNGITYTGQIAI